jgi:hypothetical protein
MRLSTPDDWRLRAIGGLFWEEYNIIEDTEFLYKSPGSGFYPIAPPTGAIVSDPSVRNANTAYIDDLSRGYKQRAAFGSFDFDLIPHELTFTAGTRYYKFDNWAGGATVGSFGCRPGGAYAVNPVHQCVQSDEFDDRGFEEQGFRVQESRQFELARDARRTDLLHLVARLSTGRIQPLLSRDCTDLAAIWDFQAAIDLRAGYSDQ